MKPTITSSVPPASQPAAIPAEQGLYIDKHRDIWAVNHLGEVVFIFNTRSGHLYSACSIISVIERSREYGPFTPYIGAIAITSSNS